MAVKRSIYLINPKFQLKFSLFATVLVLIPFALYPVIIYNLIQFAVENCNSSALADNLSAYSGKLMFMLVAQYLTFALIVFIACIFLSHKIAGPLFKLKKYLEKIKSGHSPGHLFFRKGDNFQDIAENFNEAMDVINEKQYKLAMSIEQVKNRLVEAEKKGAQESSEEVKKAIYDLEAIQDHYRG